MVFPLTAGFDPYRSWLYHPKELPRLLRVELKEEANKNINYQEFYAQLFSYDELPSPEICWRFFLYFLLSMGENREHNEFTKDFEDFLSNAKTITLVKFKERQFYIFNQISIFIQDRESNIKREGRELDMYLRDLGRCFEGWINPFLNELESQRRIREINSLNARLDKFEANTKKMKKKFKEDVADIKKKSEEIEKKLQPTKASGNAAFSDQGKTQETEKTSEISTKVFEKPEKNNKNLARISHQICEHIAPLLPQVGSEQGGDSIRVTRPQHGVGQAEVAECASCRSSDEKYGLDAKKVTEIPKACQNTFISKKVMVFSSAFVLISFVCLVYRQKINQGGEGFNINLDILKKLTRLPGSFD